MAVKDINTSGELKSLVEQLLNKNRKRVVCVFTKPFFTDQIEYDYEAIADKTAKFCDHYLIINSDLTREMQELLPERSYVFGGAARTYPISFAIDPGHFAPLRNMPRKSTLSELTDQLESDIYTAANVAGILAQFENKTIECEVTVEAIFAPSLAVVKLPNGERLSLRQEITFPGIPVEWVFEKGQKLKGRYMVDEKLFLLDGAKVSEQDFLAEYPHSTVTLGLVRKTDRKHATIAVHPSLVYELEKHEVTGNPYDTVDGYLVVGEVLPVRIYRDPQGRTRLRLDDIDDDEVVVPAPALIPGGLPWLEEERDLFSDNLEVELSDIDVIIDPQQLSDAIEAIGLLAEAEQDTTSIPMPGPSITSGEKPTKAENRELSRLREAYAIANQHLVAAREQIQRYEDQLRDVKAELGRERQRNRQANQSLLSEKAAAREKRSLAKIDNSASTTFSRRERYESDEEWMREEIRRVWLGRYTPADRKKYVLDQSSFSFEPDFFELFTPQHLPEDKARKTVRAMLDLVTKREAFEGVRETHPLFKDGRSWVEDCNTVMRMHLENRTPQAKRLTYWSMRDGTFKLIKVDKHDEFDL